jgi:hypothetical protein
MTHCGTLRAERQTICSAVGMPSSTLTQRSATPSSLVMTHRLQSMAQAQFCSRGRLANISHS